MIVLLVLLAACGTGDAEESQFYEEREATTTAQMPIVQATTTARFFSGTPTAGPTMTPIAVLADLTLATSVNGNGEPGNRVSGVSGGTIYAAAKIHDVSPGTIFSAVWGRPDGTEITRPEQEADRSASNAWVSFSWDTSGQGGGDYAVFIYADSMLIGSLAFSIG